MQAIDSDNPTARRSKRDQHRLEQSERWEALEMQIKDNDIDTMAGTFTQDNMEQILICVYKAMGERVEVTPADLVTLNY